MSTAEGDKNYHKAFEKFEQKADQLRRTIESVDKAQSSFLDTAERVGTSLQNRYDAALNRLLSQGRAPSGTIKYRLSDDMQTVFSVETPNDPELNIIVKPVAPAKSPIGMSLLGLPHPLATAR
ncbi:MAG: hypothetical protein AAB521_01720 [Patescibacteria group bacterium]